jgi:hypothetical protein
MTAEERAGRQAKNEKLQGVVMGAPLLAGARYAGLTQRQSQAAFSYMPASQNWQVISKRILGMFRDET